MRELTKSIFSFSWVMSLFGVQQAVNLTDPKKAVGAFDAITETATKEFDRFTKTTFQVGDRLQRQVVDAAFSIFSPDALDPVRLVRTTSDLFRESADSVSQAFHDVTEKMQSSMQQSDGGASTANAHNQGWGPMGGASNEAAQESPWQSPPTPQPPPEPQSHGWGPMPGSSPKR